MILLAGLASLTACGPSDAVPGRGLARVDSLALDPEQAVRRTVNLFGARMQTVALVAPDSIAASRLQEAYGTLVTPDLLSDWMAHPDVAPGRRGSTPWPDRIEVQSVRASGVDEYLVTGALVYASRAAGKRTNRVSRAVRLRVRRGGDGSWRISMFEQPRTDRNPS